jgi:hypothetical protein
VRPPLTSSTVNGWNDARREYTRKPRLKPSPSIRAVIADEERYVDQRRAFRSGTCTI